MDANCSLSSVWQRLSFPCLQSEIKEILFLLVHGKLPVTERLFRCGLANDPYCDFCLDFRGASESICNIEHYFCSCLRVMDSWAAVRDIVFDLLEKQVFDDTTNSSSP